MSSTLSNYGSAETLGTGQFKGFDQEKYEQEKYEMAKAPIDRRISRTRSTLQHALIALILEKGYETISVEDICETANVGRSTFYTHYTSKDDLKRSGIAALHKQLLAQQSDARAAADDSSHDSLSFSLMMFEHARDHLDLYRALAGSHGGVVALGGIRKMLGDLVRNEIIAAVKKKPADAAQREIAVQFLVGAYMSILTWWLDGGAKLPPHQIDATFRRLALQGIPAITC